MGDADREIRNLLYLYAERMDAGDLTGVADLFAHASYASGDGPPARGREFVERVNRELVILYEDGTPRTRHLTSNTWLEVDEEAGTARARSTFTVLQGLPGRPIEPIVTGRYQDAFERVDGRWRFSARRIFMDHTGDLSRHLRLDRLSNLLGGA